MILRLSFEENVSGGKELDLLCGLRKRERGYFQKDRGRLDSWQNFLQPWRNVGSMLLGARCFYFWWTKIVVGWDTGDASKDPMRNTLTSEGIQGGLDRICGGGRKEKYGGKVTGQANVLLSQY